jgi:hypothetical protein
VPAFIASFNGHTGKEWGRQWALPDVAEVATYHRIAGGGKIRQSGVGTIPDVTLTRDWLVTLDEYTDLAGDVGTTAALIMEHITGDYTLKALRGSPGEIGIVEGELSFVVTLELEKA